MSKKIQNVVTQVTTGIDWKVRLRHKTFWISLVSALVLLFQQLGIQFFPENTMDITNTILTIFTILGVINNPTTNGLTD